MWTMHHHILKQLTCRFHINSNAVYRERALCIMMSIIVILNNQVINFNIVVLEYNAPSPPRESGDHRYLFLAFSQQKEITDTVSITNRCHFDLDEYAKQYGLSEIPDAVNMFKTKQP